MKRRKMIWAVVALGLAAAGVGAWYVKMARQPVAPVSQGPVAARVVARGEIVARDGVADVRARIDGRVLAVHVREGDHVVAGQLLAELESNELGAQLARLEAERRAADATATLLKSGNRRDEIALARAEASAARAEALAADERALRTAALAASRSISQQESDDAGRVAQAARARFEAAEARARLVSAGARPQEIAGALERAVAAEAAVRAGQDVLERARLTAPIAGVVLARRIDPGDTVVAGVALFRPAAFELADPTQTEVRIEVEEIDAARAAVGLPVSLTTRDGRPVARGRIVRVAVGCEARRIGADASQVRADGLVLPAWVELDGPPMTRPIGLQLEALIELPPVVVGARVPRSSVVVEDGVATVEVKEGWRIRTHQVTVRAMDDAWAEIEGLAPGAEVVARPAAR